jgi:hypothetical protein
MPTPPPRHLARPRRPWRLLLFIFGLATAILAALVASATLLPQPQPPRHAPGVALPTSPARPAPTSALTTTTGDREPTTTTSPSTIPGPEQEATGRPPTTARPATAPAPTSSVASTTTVASTSTEPATTTTGPVILPGSRPANISVATVGTLLPLLGVLYLLRGLLPQAGGKHTRRRRHANHRGRRG